MGMLCWDDVERDEMRILLVYLRRFFEYFLMFEELDKSGDRRLSMDEFVRAVGRGQLGEWGMEIVDPVKVFNEIDRDGAGMVLFEEFV